MQKDLMRHQNLQAEGKTIWLVPKAGETFVDQLVGIYKEYLSAELKDGNITTTFIPDYDGTLQDGNALFDDFMKNRFKNHGNIKQRNALITATGRLPGERMYSRKFDSGNKSMAACSYILVGGGGCISIIKGETADQDINIITPIQTDIDVICEAVATGLECSVAEVFSGEHLCVHYYDENAEDPRFKAIVGIPVAKCDEPIFRELLKPYNGSIVDAIHAGVKLPYGDIAFDEYGKRGMPWEMIRVFYESDFHKYPIIELTVVAGDEWLEKAAKEVQKLGFKTGLQEDIRDRKMKTRRARRVSPGIVDIVEPNCEKDAHVKALAMAGAPNIIALGDQGNDPQLFLKETAVSIVANAARCGEEGGWEFAINATKLAASLEKDDPRIFIHAKKNEDEINWIYQHLLNLPDFEARMNWVKWYERSFENRAMRRWLINGAIPGTMPEKRKWNFFPTTPMAKWNF